MTGTERRLQAESWRRNSRRTYVTAQPAFQDGDFRSAASRAYYAAYQGAAGVCVLHGDETQFPHNWRNPAHDQLPELIRKNGSLTFVGAFASI